MASSRCSFIIFFILLILAATGQSTSRQTSITHDCTDPTEYTVSIGETSILPFNGSFYECFRYKVVFLELYTVGGVLFQVHTRNRDATISKTLRFSYETTTVGRDIGLVDFNDGSQQSIDFYVVFDPIYQDNGNRTLKSDRALIAVQGISANDPVPGGCASTSNLLYDAQLSLRYDSISTTVTFMDGNLPGRPTCDTGNPPPIKQISYYMYVYFLPERNFDEDSYFNAIKLMLNTSSVQNVGHKVVDLKLTSSDPKRVDFDSVTGEGVVYNVMLVGGGQNVYIPVATYACNLVGSACLSGVPVVSKVTGVLIALLGLFICFLGHRFFHIEVAVMWFVIFFFIFYCIVKAHSPTGWSELDVQLLSLGVSVVPTVFLTFLWLLFGYYYPNVFIFSVFATLMFTLILLFTPLGTISYLDIPYVYALVVVCGTVVFIIPFICIELGRFCCPKFFADGMPTKITNVIVCSFLGSLGVIFGIGSFLPTSLNLIWNNFLDRVTIPGFDFTMYQAYPFETIEIVLTAVWVLLLIAGATVQFLITIKKRPFPEVSLYQKYKQRRERRKGPHTFRVNQHRPPVRPLPRVGVRTSDERSALLSPGNSPAFYHTTY